ncbi:unnamed protein product [Sphagnum troendelagicum]
MKGRSRNIVKMAVLSLMVNGLMLCMSATAISDSIDTSALMAFKRGVIDTSNKLSNWQGDDPCGDQWSGVLCNSTNIATNVLRVTELRLLNYNLGGQLAPELGNLSQLVCLDLMWNNITGNIPPTIGNLQNLYLLLLNGNLLIGPIPSEIAQLTNLNRLQLDQNQLSGPLPPTLGNLTQVRHLHLNNNSFSGTIPHDLGRLQHLSHLLLDNNNMEGPLPVELINIPTLTIVQLDNNPNISSMIPLEWFQIPTLIKLSMRNCSLIGSIPDLGALTNLTYLDLSRNNLNGTLPSNISSTLTTVNFGNNYLTGVIPDSYGSELQQLQALQLADNLLSGSIPASLGSGQSFSNPKTFLLVDLQNNMLSGLNSQLLSAANGSTNVGIWLAGNQKVCSILAPSLYLEVCMESDTTTILQASSSLTSNLTCPSCPPPNMPIIGGPHGVCQCATPIAVVIRLKSPAFTFFDRFEQEFLSLVSSALNISLSQLEMWQLNWDAAGKRLEMTLLIFPLNSTFDTAEFQSVYNEFASWDLSQGSNWSLSVIGPYELIMFGTAIQSTSQGKRLSTGSIVGIVMGAAFFASILVAFATFLILHQHGKKRRTPMESMLPPGIKIAGVKAFTFEELANATNNFSPENEIGQGGYGKVYRGTLEDNTVVAIKRAQEGSMQGSHEFYTEIELLSRVHHRNLVSLLGFCNVKGEQMLVYEFIANGNLRDHLMPIEMMDFATRIHIALGTARGILYLHREADPPIFHRDIKANNILLDQNYNAKVADFGLSRLAPELDADGSTAGPISTTLKGTPGYMDPAYFMTNNFTDKSDVYSFGIVLLELITGKMPITHGKNIVTEVNEALEGDTVASMVDPCMGTSYPSDGLDRLLKLALSCCQDEYDARPYMIDVTRELEDIWRLIAASYPIPLNKGSDSPSVDFRSIDIAGHSSQTSRVYNAQDMSYLSVERVDSSEQIHPRLWPR